jgi:hypothetical protein
MWNGQREENLWDEGSQHASPKLDLVQKDWGLCL